MKLSLKKRFISLILVSLMLLPCASVANGTTADQLSGANDKKDSIAEEIQNTKDEIEKLGQDKTDVESYIKQLDEKQAGIAGKISSLNEQLTSKQTEIDENEVLLEQAKVDIQDQYESMKLRIKYMYEHSNETYFEVLLSSSDMGDMLNKAEYISKITEYDREMLVRYVETEQLISDTETLLQNDYEQIASMKESVEAQQSSLELVQQAKNEELASLTAQTTHKESYMSQLEKDKAEQESEIQAIEAEIKKQEEEAQKQAALKQQAANNATNAGGNTGKNTGSNTENNTGGNTGGTTTPTYNGGMFAWPTASTRITSNWGDAEERSSPHNGIDIGALSPGVSGDPIYAAADGVVAWANYSSSAGNWIGISHGDGLITVYMHNSQILISKGDTVSKGQKIALMGSTGNSTGAHLHFGVRLNGSYVNPWNYLK